MALVRYVFRSETSMAAMGRAGKSRTSYHPCGSILKHCENSSLIKSLRFCLDKEVWEAIEEIYAMSTATAIDPQQLIQQAIKKVTAIATLPEITAKIIKTVEDPKSTAAALHKIVSHDPALVTRILKVVNSAFYGLPGQIA